MKKLASLMLGLSLIAGTAAFAADAPKEGEKKEQKKKKGGKKKAAEEKEKK